jgi:NAD(P)H-nitrite reductase large subunit
MPNQRHHVVIGNGVAGSQAAITLREREPEAKVTLITLSALLFYNRYDLPKVFRGRRDWRDFLVYPPEFYAERNINVRRRSEVANVDAEHHSMTLGHKEDIRYDTLLVAAGGRGYLPEELSEYRSLMHNFGNFEQAIAVTKVLPEGGRVVMLGGDMIGLDLARTLADTGYRVTLIAGEYTFWPHEVDAAERQRFVQALQDMGVEVIEQGGVGGIASIERGVPGMAPRRVLFRDGSDVYGDVVMPFFGLVPSVEFMVGSGVDIERGLLVNPELRTTNENIHAAGDVCQIWNDAERRYRFYYGWKNVRAMGDLAARNMTGGAETFAPTQDEKLRISADGRITSPFWEYE